jgi:hypothetical protein
MVVVASSLLKTIIVSIIIIAIINIFVVGIITSNGGLQDDSVEIDEEVTK